MNLTSLPLILLFSALSGCATYSATKPTEALDETTGLTIASMESPLEFVSDAAHAPTNTERRVSFAYLGPVEWNQMGTITYGLWVHVAPGNDKKVSDIRAPGAVSIELDDGSMELVPIDAPSVGREPYKAVVSWGQTGYFALTDAGLKRLAASQRLNLGFRGDDGSAVIFIPSHDTHATLTRYAISRGVIVD